MNIFSLTSHRLLVPLMLGSMLVACEQGSEPGTEKGLPGNGISPPLTRATQPVRSQQGSRILASYSGSYALVIGESEYTRGWPDLEAVPGELEQVAQILQSQGFTVEKSFDLNGRQLRDRFETFIEQYGFDEDNRLLFFYSGHGYTLSGKGYIVPVDAADPNFDEKGFLRKAVEMNQILTWARRISAKHALFLFDSCFSGTVFDAKGPKDLSEIPSQISEAAEEPVRQFITAGDAHELIPAKSVFIPAFIDALRYGWADLYNDGYITGQELGLYLKNKVPQHAYQTPQYGKIRDYELSRGDFIFVVGGGNQVVAQPSMPVTPVPMQKPDRDRDGITDEQDNCPRNTAIEISQGIDSNGCPLDSDRDYVADYRDSCPRNTSNELSQGVDSNGCPLDYDKDGVANYRDSCPSTFYGIKVIENGCPYRYTDNADGTVTDNRSGLIWLKNASCFGFQDWYKAMQSAANLASGQCGLRDGSRRGMWRLPTKGEWEAMIDKKYRPLLSNAAGTGQWKEGDAFSGVKSDSYWSSTSDVNDTHRAWRVTLDYGYVFNASKDYTSDVWPVRGGV